PQGVVLLEVFPLYHATRPALGNTRDERLDQRVVWRAPEPRLAIPEIQRVREQERVVGADIQGDRQRERRVDPRGCGVQRQLADRNRHAARTLIAQSEDPLVVGDYDEPDVFIRTVAEELGNPIDIGRRDPQAACPTDDVTELLARPSDGRGVDDWQELLGMLGQEPVEQRRVAILERGQADVLLQRIVLAAEVLE